MANLNWICEIKRRGAVLGMHYLCYGMNKYVPYLFGAPFCYRNVLYKDSCLYKVREEDALLKSLLRSAFESDPDYFLNVAARIRADARVIRGFTSLALSTEAVRNTVEADLPRLFESYISLMSHFGTYFRYMEPSISTLEAMLVQMLQKRLSDPSQIQDALVALSISSEQDYATSERRSLLGIAADADRILGYASRKALGEQEYAEQVKRRADLVERLQHHARSYSWMGTADHLGNPYTIEDYIAVIRGIGNENIDTQIQRLEDLDLERRQRAESIIAGLHLSPAEKRLVESVQQYAYINGLIKEIVLSSQQRAEPLLTRISHILDADRSTLLALSFEEILLYLRQGKPLDARTRGRAEERKQDWAMLISADKITLYSGRELAEFKAQFHEPSYGHLAEVVGTAASLGRVTAIAKVIDTVEQFGKIERGDIVITSMTTPEYSAVMDKIAGIVTDEGGITSHAGIIARERGVPCLVGTKIATRVFTDGDTVQIDTHAGTARKVRSR